MAAKSTTIQQYESLVAFMEEHPEFAKGFNSTSDARVSSKRLWDQIGQRLNSHGPPIRTSDGWKKVWADFKYNIKKKLRINKQSISGTGGGPSRIQTFSAIEESVIQIINLREAVDGTPGTVSLGNSELIIPPTIPLSPPRPTESINIIESSDNNHENDIIELPPQNNRENRKPVQSKSQYELIEKQILQQKNFHDTVTTSLASISETLISTNQIMKRTLRMEEKKYEIYKKKLLLKEKEIKVMESTLEFNKNKLAMEAKERLEERKFKLENLELKKRKLELQETNNNF